MPKVDRMTAARVERQAYPGRLRARTDGCWRTRLSDAADLTQIGVGEVELLPGGATSLMHWHEVEDEFVYVLDGEVVLVEQDGGEQVLRAGDSAGFKAGVANGHTFENRADRPARLLEIGPRTAPTETAHYVGLDLLYKRNGPTRTFETRDGRVLGSDDEVEPLA
ncbi:MAG: cupin domain-containing protein [Pseudomonadota bacterium]